jgi:hypothetical protein
MRRLLTIQIQSILEIFNQFAHTSNTALFANLMDQLAQKSMDIAISASLIMQLDMIHNDNKDALIADAETLLRTIQKSTANKLSHLAQISDRTLALIAWTSIVHRLQPDLLLRPTIENPTMLLAFAEQGKNQMDTSESDDTVIEKSKAPGFLARFGFP